MAEKSRKRDLTELFQGRWRIAEMELWNRDALDLVEVAFIQIEGEEGEMRFIAVRAWLDIRYTLCGGRPRMDFSWEGVDERDQRSGRGWLLLTRDGRLTGRFYFHMGDESSLICEHWCSSPSRSHNSGA